MDRKSKPLMSAGGPSTLLLVGVGIWKRRGVDAEKSEFCSGPDLWIRVIVKSQQRGYCRTGVVRERAERIRRSGAQISVAVGEHHHQGRHDVRSLKAE